MTGSTESPHRKGNRIFGNETVCESCWRKRGLAQYHMARRVYVDLAKQQPVGRKRGDWSLSLLAKKTGSRRACTACRFICLPLQVTVGAIDKAHQRSRFGETGSRNTVFSLKHGDSFIGSHFLSLHRCVAALSTSLEAYNCLPMNLRFWKLSHHCHTS